MESSNTVGYKKLNLDAGFVMYTPMFVGIGGGSISIQDLKPSGEDVGGWGDVSIQIVDSDGNIDGEYAWYTSENSGRSADLWLDLNSENLDPANISFEDGDAFLLYSDNDVTLLCAGEVANVAVTKQIDAGFNSFGNSKHSATSIQALVPEGDDVGGWGDVSIQIVDPDGNIDGEYAWYTTENSGRNVDCWLDLNTENLDPAVVTFAPGEAFLLYSDNAAEIEIPAFQAN